MATITDEEKKSIAEDVKKQLIASAKSVQDFEKITELPESGSVTLPVVQPDGSAKTFDAGNWLKDREDAYKATQSATADAKTATSAANAAAESANDAATEANSAADAAKKRTEELNDTNVGKFDSRVSKLEANVYKDKYIGETCGRYWDFNNGTPRAAGYVGNLQMLRDIPELLNLGGYLVKNDHSRRKLSSKNHYFYQDGTPAKLDGSEGYYQFGWNRKWYMKPSLDETTKIFKIEFSITPMVGWYAVPVGSDSASGWATIDRTTNTLASVCNYSARYRGGGNNSSFDDAYNSQLGMPATSLTTVNWLKYARKNGEGWLCSTGKMTCAINILFALIMGDLNVCDTRIKELDSNGLRQGGLGIDVVKRSWCPMDTGAELGDFIGAIDYESVDANGTKKTFQTPCFFGYKSFFGFWRNTCDEFCLQDNNNRTHYFVEEPYYTDFSFKKEDDYTKGVSTTAGGGYISRLALDRFEMFPIETKGSANTFFCDMLSLSSSDGVFDCVRNGGAERGNDVGLWMCFLANGEAYANWSSSLSEAAEPFKSSALTEEDIKALTK